MVELLLVVEFSISSIFALTRSRAKICTLYKLNLNYGKFNMARNNDISK